MKLSCKGLFNVMVMGLILGSLSDVSEETNLRLFSVG